MRRLLGAGWTAALAISLVAPCEVGWAQAEAQPPETAVTPGEVALWLEANPADPRWPEVLEGMVSAPLELDLLVRVLESAGAQPPAGVDAELALRLAALLDSGGRLTLALRYFGHAARVARDAEVRRRALLAQAAVAMDLGEWELAVECLDLAARATPDAAREAEVRLVRALVVYEQGAESAAVAELQRLAQSADTPAATRTRALLALVLHYRAARQSDQAARCAAALEGTAPGSPEAVIAGAGQGRVTLALAPRLLLAQLSEAPGSPSSLPLPTPPPPRGAEAEEGRQASVAGTPRAGGAYRIQTGSFLVQENADYMARDLSRAGFDARVTPVVLAGKTYYRVILEVAGTAEDAARLLLRLKDSGYEGVLLP